MATNIYEVKFFTNEWFLDTYKTAFADEFVALTDEEKARFIELASTRIKRIADRPFIDLNDLEQEQAAGAQKAAARIFDYWLEYGLDLNRVSGSVSMGSFSASQTAPNDPDYIPENVYEVLQDVGLYTPVGYLIEKDLRRIDDESAITYGVRFKGLERVKDVSLLKTQDEQNNKELVVPTWNTVSTAIASQIAGNRGFRGLFTTTNLDNVLTEFDTYLNSLITNPVNGDTADLKYLENGSLYNELVENYLYEGAWVKVSQNYDEKAAIVAINDEFQDLKNNAITLDTGNLKYLKLDGTNTMSDTYVPSQPKNVITLDYLNTQLVAKQNQITVNANKNTQQDTRLDTLETLTSPFNGRITALETKDTTQDSRISALETLTTPLPARITALETTSTSYGTRIGAVESKDTVQDTDIAGLKTRIAAVESNQSTAATYKSAVRKWVGTQNGSATTAGANTTDINLSTLKGDDNLNFEFTSGKELRLWVKGTSTTLGATLLVVDVIAGRTEPVLLEAVRGSTGSTLEVVAATLTTAGILTITRNAGTDIQFNTIQAVEMKEDILALATSLATKSEVSAVDTKATTAGTTATEALTKVNAIDLTPLTTNIANNKAAIDTNTANIATNTANIATNTTGLATTKATADSALAKSNANESKIGTTALTTTAQTMTGAIEEVNGAYKAADTSLHTTITTEQSSKIKYYNGSLAESFIAENIVPAKFNNTTLFTKIVYAEGDTKLGIGGAGQEFGTHSNGEVISHTHQSPYYDTFNILNATGGAGRITISANATNQNHSATTYDGGSSGTDSHKEVWYSGTKQNVSSTGGTGNKAQGFRVLKVEYYAKKDITFAEMGE